MKRYTLLYLLPLLFVACSDHTEGIAPEQDEAWPIQVTASYGIMQTRADASGFTDGDAIGLFVVDYDDDGNASELAMADVRAHNVRYTYDGTTWTANYQPYWKNRYTPADIYGYYPYDQQMQSPTAYAFSVNRQQDEKGYLASDLLRAKSERVIPTTEAVQLQYRHIMAGLCIQLERGEGFSEEEWKAADKGVLVESTILNGTVNLQSGSVMVNDGEPQAIKPLTYAGTYRAVVIPQSVAAGESLLSITVDGRSSYLTKEAATTYLSGKMHNFTVTVNKNADGNLSLALKADDIVAWMDDPDLHDGLIRQYTIVTLTRAGTLQEEVDKVCDDYSKLYSLKIVGPMNGDDREFIQNQLLYLRDVNMAKVEMEDGHLGGFHDHKRLQHFIFPEKGIRVIDGQAFKWCPLMGDLVIPEGVEIISGGAFMDCGMRGHLSLPTTLKRIEGGAFAFNGLTGELRLPDGIEYIDPYYYYCFQGCDFEGTLYLPETLTSIPNMGFPKITGTIVIPPGITEVSNFEKIGCTHVEFHDGVVDIGAGAFSYANLQGELMLPPNLKHIGGAAFIGTRITNIVFPDALRVMDNGGYSFEGIFADCKYLTGTVVLPRNVARIPAGCFRNCTAITGLYIPEGVDIIAEIAFENCYSINSIVCEDEEPPVVLENAFFGVNKDNFTVEVPKGSVEKYREAPGWKEFKRIAEHSNFVCRPMQANALNTAHTEQLILNADGAWKVEHCPDWATVTPSSGMGKTQLTLTFKPLSHGSGNRTDSILFVMPEEDYHTYCRVSQYDYEHEEDGYLALQTATKGNNGGIDILFIGDGWDGEDISNGSYLDLVRQQTEHFFDLEPYKSHRDYFNVYVTFPLSQEKGVNTMNTYVNNHFGTLYGYDGTMCTSNQLLTELSEVRSYAVEHTPLTQDRLGSALIIFVPNSDAYEGVTYYEWYGSPVSICPPSSRPYPQDTRGVIQHEAGGHGFAYLGDEEIARNAWPPASVKAAIENQQRSGWYANLSTTSGLHSVPWADFIFDPRYSDHVDVFEGGFGYMRGIFRPEQNSCMNYGIPYYNAPSRLAIMRRIRNYAHESFDMDYFYAHDSNVWGRTGMETRSGGQARLGGSSYAGSNQHHAPQVVDGRKMADMVKRIRMKMKE